MKFETRSVGVFEVLVVRLEGREVFDAGRLRHAVTEMVDAGHRRLIVDLGEVDYLYSDSINAFIAVNRRMIESSGRLGVLVTNPKVHEILLRAGIENILRIYRNESELIADSREIMRQSSSYSRPADLPDSPSQIGSVSQAFTAHAVYSPNSAPEDSGSFRAIRRRSGARTEVRPRRRGGRALDGDYDSQLPPELPEPSEFESRGPAIGRKSEVEAKTPQSAPPQNLVSPPPPPAPTSLRRSDVPEFILPDGTIFDTGIGADAISFDLTGPVDAGATTSLPREEGRESAFLDPPSSASQHGGSEPGVSQSVSDIGSRMSPPSSAPQRDSSFRADFSWDEPSAGVSSDLAVPPPAPPTPAEPSSEHRSSKGASRSESASTEQAPSIPAVPKQRSLVDPMDDHPTQILSVSSLTKGPQVIPPPEPIAAPRVVSAPPPPEPIAAPRVVSAPPPPEPIAAPRVVSAPPPPEPIAAPRVVSAPPPPEPVAAPRVVSAPPPPEPIAAPRVVSAPPPPEPVAAPRVVSAPPPPEPIAAPRVVSAPPPPEPIAAPRALPVELPPEPTSIHLDIEEVPPSPIVKIGPVDPPPAPQEHVAPPEPIVPAVTRPRTRPPIPPAPKGDTSSTMLTVSPKRKKSSNGITSSSIRTRQEQEPKSPVIWLVVGGIILLFGIGAWIWLGRTPETEIPAPTATTPSIPAPVATPAPDSTPVASEPPKVSEPEEEEDAPAVEKPEGGSKKTPSSAVAKKEAKPLPPPPPPPPPEPDPADKKTEKVFLTSRPSGAKVVLDGRSVGKTPVEVEIKGKGHLTLTLDGYKVLEKDVRVAEVRGTLNLELQASEQAPAVAASSEPMGKFFLSSSPAGAEIRYQGKLIGKTPKMVELPVGSRKLDLQSGALQKSVDVELKEGQNPAQHVPL